jgi:hypothetical protein
MFHPALYTMGYGCVDPGSILSIPIIGRDFMFFTVAVGHPPVLILD